MQKMLSVFKKSLLPLIFVCAVFFTHTESALAFSGFETYGYMQTDWWGMAAYYGYRGYSSPPDPVYGTYSPYFSFSLIFDKSSYVPGETVNLSLNGYAHLLSTNLVDYNYSVSASASSPSLGVNSSCSAMGYCVAVSSFTAPSTPGTYSINLNGCVANNTYYKCFPYVATFTVANPVVATTTVTSDFPLDFIPATIQVGGTSTMSYNSGGAMWCSGTGVINNGFMPSSGTNIVTPVMNVVGVFTQTVTCIPFMGPSTSATKTLNVIPASPPPPTVNLYFSYIDKIKNNTINFVKKVGDVISNIASANPKEESLIASN